MFVPLVIGLVHEAFERTEASIDDQFQVTELSLCE